MKLIRRLQDKERDKLKAIGEERDALVAKIERYQQQVATLEAMSDDYLKPSAPNPLLHQNQLQMYHQLQPMIKEMHRQLGFLEAQKQTLVQQWQAQLARWQSMKWYADKKDAEAIEQLARAEQKTLDDLASRRRPSFG